MASLSGIRRGIVPVLVIALLAIGLPAAFAAPPSAFLAIDGSVINQANTPAPPYDWANGGALTSSTVVGGTWTRAGAGGVFDGGKYQGTTRPPTPPTLTPAAASDPSITSAKFIVDPLGSDTTACGTGDPTTFSSGADKNNNDINGFTWGTGTVPNKDDLSNVYALAHSAGSTDEIFFGAERVVNNGDSHVDFEFLQSPISTNARKGGCAPDSGGTFSGHRTQGDLLLSVDFTDGGTLGGFSINRWQCDAVFNAAHNGLVCDPASFPDATYSSIPTSTANVVVNGAGPTGCGGWVCRDDNGAPQASLLTNDLLEGGINLADAGFTGCFNTFLPHTRSAPAFDAVLKDFAGPFSFSNCKQPIIATTLRSGGQSGSAISVSAGAAVTDTATLSDTAGTPSGTVTYQVFTDKACSVASTTPPVSQTVSLSGGVVGSTSPVTFSVPGTYYWQASYSGDAASGGRNLPAVSPCRSEVLTVLGAHIALAKTADATPVSDGTPVGFVVTATNTGQGSASGVSVSDPLPAAGGISWSVDSAGSDPGCSISGSAPQILTCTFGTVAAGESRHVHVTSSTSSETGTTRLVNVASVTTTNDGGAVASATVEVLAAHLGVTKTADASPVSAGDPLGFTILLANSGPGTAHGVTVTDSIPVAAGTAWTVDTKNTTAAACAVTGGVLACGPQDLASGASAAVHLVSPSSAQSCGIITNTASADSLNDGSGTSSASITVNCPDLAVTKTAVASPINAGDPAGFAILVSNNGAGTAHGVTLTDVLPGGLVWGISSQPAGQPCSISGGTLSCAYGDLKPGASANVVVTAPTTAQNCGTLNNTATASATNEPASDTANDTSSASIVVNCSQTPPRVVITKTADKTSRDAGSDIGFVMTVRNVGGSTASDVVLTDHLPSGDGIHWSIDSAVAGCGITKDALTCTKHVLAAGDSFSVHITSPTTLETRCGEIENTASVTSADGGSGRDSATIHIRCAEIKIEKIAEESSQNAGGEIGFTIKVRNTGDATAHDVVMTDRLPQGSGLEWSLDEHVDGCSITADVLTCRRESIEPEDGFTVHLDSPTSEANCGEIDNTATVKSSNGGSDKDSARIQVLCAVIKITKTADDTTQNTGSNIGFTIKVANSGDASAQDVVMSDPLPTGAGIQWSLDQAVSGCSINDGLLTCRRESLQPGESFTVHIDSPTTGATVCATYKNTASVTTPNGGADTASASVAVTGCVTPVVVPPAVLATVVAPVSNGPEVLGIDTTRGPDTTQPTQPFQAVEGQTLLPMTGYDPRPLTLVALMLLATGGVLCAAVRHRWWGAR